MGSGDLEPALDDVLVGPLDLPRADDLQPFSFEAGVVGVVELGLFLQEVEGFLSGFVEGLV